MRIQIASDLHLEHLERRFAGYRVIEPCGADLLILAGDIHRHARALKAFGDWPCPVLYVLGNHEYYRSEMSALLADIRSASRGSGLRVLENDTVELGHVRFVGATLWTSFEVDRHDGVPSMSEIAARLPDFEIIETAAGTLTPAMTCVLHERSRAHIAQALETPFDGPTVVITHHAPHRQSIHARFANDPVNAAFVSDLGDLMGPAALWVHGHMHNSFDYAIKGTRVVANPRGYPLNLAAAESTQDIVWENPGFDAQFVVEL